MYRSPSHLPEDARSKIADTLNARLADGLDLHSQIKVAHWNIKGPQFAALHPLFETFAVGLAAAQRRHRRARRDPRRQARYGTARHVAKTSQLAGLPAGHHARPGAREAARRAHRDVPGRRARVARRWASKLGDTDTVDLLTGIVTEFEKHAWFLRASLDS